MNDLRNRVSVPLVYLLIAFAFCMWGFAAAQEVYADDPEGDRAYAGQAYARFETATGTLVFFRSTEVYENGQVFIDGNGADVIYYTGIETDEYYDGSDVPWHEVREQVAIAVFEDGVAPLSTAYWFYGMTNLQNVEGLALLATDGISRMESMFEGCESLVCLDLSSFDTQTVSYMWGMFNGCRGLFSLKLGKKSVFDSDTGLPQTKWQRTGDLAGTRFETLDKYNSSKPGVYEQGYREITVSDIAAMTYNGSPRTPNPTVKYSGELLTKNTDYKLTYKNNTNAGKATVTITGTGNYTGSRSKTFTIKAKSITPKVTLSTATYTYNAKAKKPAVTVRNGSTKLTTKDYSVKYAAGRKNVGQYWVKVTLKRNFRGTKTSYFKILPKGSSIASLSRSGKTISVKWKKQSAKMAKSRITGYQIQVATNTAFTKNKKTVTVKGYAKVRGKVAKLKSSGKYYVRVRTYKVVKKKKYCSKWSAAKEVDNWTMQARSSMTMKVGKWTTANNCYGLGLSRNGYEYPANEEHLKDLKLKKGSPYVKVTSNNKNIIVATAHHHFSNLGMFYLFAKKPGKAKVKITCTIQYKDGRKAVISKVVKVTAKGGKKNTIYDLNYNCIVKGNYAYCSNDHRLFKVNLKTKKVTRLATAKRGYIDHLHAGGKYIYYIDHGNGMPDGDICRVNTSTKKRTVLAKKTDYDYTISGSKIYYSTTTWYGKQKTKKMVMSLSGKSKKSTKISVSTPYWDDDLGTPKGTNNAEVYLYDDVDWDDPYKWDKGANYYLYDSWRDNTIRLEHLSSPYI